MATLQLTPWARDALSPDQSAELQAAPYDRISIGKSGNRWTARVLSGNACVAEAFDHSTAMGAARAALAKAPSEGEQRAMEGGR